MKLLRLLFLVLFVIAAVWAEDAAATESVEDADAAPAEPAAEPEQPAADPTGLSAEERAAVDASKETHEFQAEVSRLMDILINSLYSNREIFLRELISNSADACEKIRSESLTNPEALGEGETAEMNIRIKIDKDAKTISITDKGVGMTKEELVKNLGIVAKSGTSDFLDKVGKSEDNLSLIGQFGVGFYSVYLVSERVTVISKSNNGPQAIWESNADRTFTVTEDPRGNTLGRGTQVILHLKEDAEEFLANAEMEKLVTRYSSFINFPIYLWEEKTEEVEVPVEEEPEEKAEGEGEDAEKPEGDDELEVGEDEDGDKEESKPKTKKIQKDVSDWKLLNTAKAIWTRTPSEITDEEYEQFYKSLTKDYSGYMEKIHFTAEGEITFKSILFIPKRAEYGLYDKFYQQNTALKLYVRRVLISDKFEDFLPKYLNFVKGVVDSEDLPLNVSRETLAQSRVLKVMGKKMTRKVLGLLRKMAEEERSGDEEEDEETEETEEKVEQTDDSEKSEEEEKKVEEDKEGKYTTFYKEFGKSIKLGVIDDRSNKSKLTKLLRYKSSKSDDKLIGLEDYVDNMQEGQKYIYYITGPSLEEVKKSPMLETLVRRGYEVIFMVEALDEYVIQSMSEFDGHDLMSITKEGLKFGDEEKEKAKLEKLTEEFKTLTDWLQGKLASAFTKVNKVAVSNRLGQFPAVLVTSQYGWSANMERIMKAQTFADPEKQAGMVSKKTMEINPRHPTIKALREKVESNPDDVALEDLAFLLHDAAAVASGFSIGEATTFASRVHRVVALGLDVDPEAVVEDEVEEEEEPAEAEPEEASAEAEVEEGSAETVEAEAEDSSESAEAEDSSESVEAEPSHDEL
jgi:heat shock protein beta